MYDASDWYRLRSLRKAVFNSGILFPLSWGIPSAATIAQFVGPFEVLAAPMRRQFKITAVKALQLSVTPGRGWLREQLHKSFCRGRR